jgi:hypothetical protein
VNVDAGVLDLREQLVDCLVTGGRDADSLSLGEQSRD